MLRRERIPGSPLASQEEMLSTEKRRGTPGSCHHSRSLPDVSVHSTGTCISCTASTFTPWIDSNHGGPWHSPVGKHRGKASCGMTLEFLSPFLWRVPPLEWDGNAGNAFPTNQGKHPSSRATRPKWGSSACGRDPRASSRVETGMSGNFLSCSKAVKDPLEVPEVRSD